MKKTFIIISCLLVSTFINAQQFKKLVWADEFDKNGLPDAAKWSYDTGSHGWGNNELQYYTAARKQNARVENGKLIIEAIKEKYQSATYTSARLVTKNKGDWKYGKIEIKAKLPAGKGIWPAIWMLSTDWKYGNWPKSGEIDIMENVGYMPDSVFGSVHTQSFNHVINTQKTKGIYKNDLASTFHVYAINWTADKISFLVDNVEYMVFNNTNKNANEWPFDQAFHVLLNVAVGGNWGGKFGVDDNIFPQRLEVDYVRVYQ